MCHKILTWIKSVKIYLTFCSSHGWVPFVSHSSQENLSLWLSITKSELMFCLGSRKSKRLTPFLSQKTAHIIFLTGGCILNIFEIGNLHVVTSVTVTSISIYNGDTISCHQWSFGIRNLLSVLYWISRIWQTWSFCSCANINRIHWTQTLLTSFSINQYITPYPVHSV